MILRVPEYFNKFRCIADKCPDTCCVGWEIDIDEETMLRYKGMRGVLGERIRASVSEEGCPHFCLTSDDRCPFLNKTGLCDIISCLGEDALCDICREHPRYYNEFGNIREGGVGLACYAAAELILHSRDGFKQVSTETDEPCCGRAKEYKRLPRYERMREEIWESICDVTRGAFTERIYHVLSQYSHVHKNKKHSFAKMTDGILTAMENAEPFDGEWAKMLSSARRALSTDGERFTDFINQRDLYAGNIFAYFIHRYFLLGVRHNDGRRRVAFAAVSTLTVLAIAYGRGGAECDEKALIICAKDYSKNIEYSEENTALMLEASPGLIN